MTARGADLEALGELGRGVAALARSGLTVSRGCATPRNGTSGRSTRLSPLPAARLLVADLDDALGDVAQFHLQGL